MTQTNARDRWATLLSRLLIFWRQPWVQYAFPWATSVTVHVTLFTVALVVLPAVVKRALSEPSREQIFVPDTALASANDIGGVPNPGLGQDPTRMAAQDTDASVQESQSWAQRKSRSLSQSLDSSNQGTDLIAAGDKESIGKGRDNSALDPFSGQSGGSMAAFGPRGGGMGNGPKSKIFGHGGNVRSIVYVCDASGSMVGQGDDALRSELKRDIANLSPLQEFNILIFHKTSDGSEFQQLTDTLLVATPTNKKRAFDFVDGLLFSNINNPLPALAEAFREQPQLVFLLSHGDFDNQYNTTSNQEVLDRLESLNQDKRVHVNTILLLGDEDKAPRDLGAFEAIMDKIARDNGGWYKKFFADEL